MITIESKSQPSVGRNLREKFSILTRNWNELVLDSKNKEEVKSSTGENHDLQLLETWIKETNQLLMTPKVCNLDEFSGTNIINLKKQCQFAQ